MFGKFWIGCTIGCVLCAVGGGLATDNPAMGSVLIMGGAAICGFVGTLADLNKV